MSHLEIVWILSVFEYMTIMSITNNWAFEEVLLYRCEFHATVMSLYTQHVSAVYFYFKEADSFSFFVYVSGFHFQASNRNRLHISFILLYLHYMISKWMHGTNAHTDVDKLHNSLFSLCMHSLSGAVPPVGIKHWN